MGLADALPVGHSLRIALIAAMAGLLAVSAPENGTGAALAVLLPLCWAWSPNRVVATLVVACYYAVAALSSWAGTWQFSGSVPMASVAYLLVVACAVLPWALLYRVDGRHTFLRLVVLCAIGIVPPLGFAHPFNPFLGVGLLFPGLGWIAFVLGIALLTLAIRRPLAIVLVFLLFGVGIDHRPGEIEGWRGIDVHLQDEIDHRQEYAVYRRVAAQFSDPSLKVAIYPEAAIGYSTAGSATVLGDAIGADQVAIVGAREGSEARWRYAMRRFDAAGDRTIYQQRLAAPIFTLASTSEPLSASAPTVAGKTILPLICFEAMTPWPYVLPLAVGGKPDAIVYMGNVAWAEPWLSDLLAGQLRHNVALWAKIFDIPAIGSIAFPLSGPGKLATIKK